MLLLEVSFGLGKRNLSSFYLPVSHSADCFQNCSSNWQLPEQQMFLLLEMVESERKTKCILKKRRKKIHH